MRKIFISCVNILLEYFRKCFQEEITKNGCFMQNIFVPCLINSTLPLFMMWREKKYFIFVSYVNALLCLQTENFSLLHHQTFICYKRDLRRVTRKYCPSEEQNLNKLPCFLVQSCNYWLFLSSHYISHEILINSNDRSFIL